MDTNIRDFVDQILADISNKQHKLILGKLTETEVLELESQLGIDLSGYQRILDNFGIKHSLKEHGDAKKEELRGQIGITNEDFEKILEIVSDPDEIETGEKSRLGKDLIKYSKVIENALFFYVEEIRTGKKELALQTIYKRKNR
ncbi:MAG: hypothetical protein EAZ97_06875 [Bacteroidetes bacterium]|nr:MAG: hypothetical protein EAZ97_06875 [Bacteroidota bacterium]